MDFQKEECIRASNVGEVLELMKAIVEFEHGTFDEVGFEEHLSKSNRFLSAIFRGKTIGAISFSTVGIENITMPVLDFVNVLRPFQRKGVGSRLCIRAIQELVRDGFTPIHCTALNPRSFMFLLSLPTEDRQHLRIQKAY